MERTSYKTAAHLHATVNKIVKGHEKIKIIQALTQGSYRTVRC